MELKNKFRGYFKKAVKLKAKAAYDLDEVMAEMEKRKDFTFENHCKDVYYWFYRNFEFIWKPHIAIGYLRRAYQICTRGWSDRDLWSLDYTIAKFTLPRLIELKKIKHGIPTSFFPTGKYEYTDEEYEEAQRNWNEVLDKMIWSMDYIANYREWDYYPEKEKYKEEGAYDMLRASDFRCQEGLDLFAKHFRSLWD